MKYLYTFLAGLVLLTACNKQELNDLTRINDHFYVKSEGANLPVQIEGNLNSGVVVLLLHGGPGGDATIYNEATKTFSNKMEENYAMVYYDQRSSGISSGKFKKREELNIKQHVLDLNRVISAIKFRYENIDKIYLMGHSWGGTLGTAFLLTPGYEEQINGWIEVDGAHNFDGTPEIKEHFRNVGSDMIANNLSVDFWDEAISFVETMEDDNSLDISQLNSYGFEAENYLAQDGFLTGEDISVDYLNMFYSSKHNNVTASTNLFFTSSGFGMFDEVSSTNFTERLNEISLPCLFLWGKYDFVVPPTLGIEAYQKVSTPVKDKRLIIFETSGHSPMINQPKSFTDEVIRWIEER